MCDNLLFPQQDTCLNGGRCIVKAQTNGSIVETCICPTNFSGSRCENCAAIQCLNGGTCRVGSSSDKYRCDCPDSFAGFYCEVDKCKDFCRNNGKCSIHPVMGPKCECLYNYSGDQCETDDKKLDCNLDCGHNGVCRRVRDNEYCDCTDGWTGRICDMQPSCTEEQCQCFEKPRSDCQ